MKPFSALYYIKQNKGRSITAAIMFLLSVLMLMGGNYIASNIWAFEESGERLDRFVTLGYLSTDTDEKDWDSVLEDVAADDRLQLIRGSGYGHGSIEYTTAMGLSMSGNSMVFTSKDEMEEAFKIMEIDCDLSKVEDFGLVLSSMYAKAAEGVGVSVGDVLVPAFSGAFDTRYRVDAIYEGNDVILFYLIESERNVGGRVYVHGKDMDHAQLVRYLEDLVGDRKVSISKKDAKSAISEFFDVFRVIFYTAIVLIGIILSVSISSWFTGQYMKRTYEFGVYRAIGRSRSEIFRKIASEIALQDLMGIIAGVALVLLSTFLLNELVYLPAGMYLPYISDMGMIGAVICNLLALIPLIFFKSRAMNRADVTEF